MVWVWHRCFSWRALTAWMAGHALTWNAVVILDMIFDPDLLVSQPVGTHALYRSTILYFWNIQMQFGVEYLQVEAFYWLHEGRWFPNPHTCETVTVTMMVAYVPWFNFRRFESKERLVNLLRCLKETTQDQNVSRLEKVDVVGDPAEWNQSLVIKKQHEKTAMSAKASKKIEHDLWWWKIKLQTIQNPHVFTARSRFKSSLLYIVK